MSKKHDSADIVLIKPLSAASPLTETSALSDTGGQSAIALVVKITQELV